MDTPTTPQIPSQHAPGLAVAPCSAFISAIEEIGREMQRNPNDSIVDIINDAFISFDIPFFAEWTDDDLDPVKIKPND